MSWVKLDDQARQHRKLLAVGPTAAWLWTCGLMYCNSQKARDGFIPAEVVAVLYPIPSWRKEVPRLLSAGLWEEVDGGYLVHDYHDYQPTPEKVLETSEAKAAAGRLGGLKSGEARRSKTEADRKATPKHRASNREADAKQDASLLPKPVPSRPDPDQEKDPPLPPEGGPPPESSSTRITPRRTRARTVQTTWPEGFAVSAAIARMCRDEGLPNPHDVVRDFESWARAKGRRYADWESAFRNWMRSAITRRDYPVWEPPAEPAEPRRTYGPPSLPPPELAERLLTFGFKPRPDDAFGQSLAAVDAPGADVRWPAPSSTRGAT